MTNVLMVTSAFPPYFGGATVQAAYLAERLQERGVKVDFITDNAERPSVHDVYKGISVYRCSSFFPHQNMSGKRSEVIFTLRVLAYLLRHHSRYDVVHLHSVRGFEIFTFPFMRLLGKKIVLKLTLVGNDDPMAFKRRRLMGKLYIWGLGFVDRFIAISSKQIELTEEAGFGRDTLLHLPNGVDLKRYSALPPAQRQALKEQLGLAGYDKIFYSIGKIEDRKHYKFLAKAWKTLSKAYPGSAFLFAGGGNNEQNAYYNELREQIAQDGLDGVVFLGHKDNVDQYMRVADAFLFASKAEGFGTVMVEGIVTGVPTLACNIEGVTEDIILPQDRDIARIYYGASPDEFADAAIDLLSNYDPAGREAAVARHQRTYGLEHITSRYIALYDELLGRTPPTPEALAKTA